MLCFNPCYSGSNSKMKILSYDILVDVNVSILVIVEVTLKYDIKATYNLFKACFNPCYSGSNSKMLNMHSSDISLVKFQSLL